MSLRSEFLCLVPVVISLYIGVPTRSNPVVTDPPWNASMLFGGACASQIYLLVSDAIPPTGMALSRIGLWMFDLAQLQILQESLESHPRRNRLTSFQYTLQVCSTPVHPLFYLIHFRMYLTWRNTHSRWGLQDPPSFAGQDWSASLRFSSEAFYMFLDTPARCAAMLPHTGTG